LTTVTTATPPGGFVHLVVGYDGSAPAGRALDAAVRLLQGRTGRIDVVYVAQLSSFAMLSPGAIAEIESDFDEIEQELRTAAAEQLGDSGAAWEFQRRQGIVADELLAAATTFRDAHPGGDRGDRGWVPRHPPCDRFGRRQPGPSFAGPPCYRALTAR
jgi:hypothetical protein